jgi:hypothetical protein
MINSKDYDFKSRIIDFVIKVTLSTIEGLMLLIFQLSKFDICNYFLTRLYSIIAIQPSQNQLIEIILN